MAYNTEHLLRVGDAKTIYDSVKAGIDSVNSANSSVAQKLQLKKSSNLLNPDDLAVGLLNPNGSANTNTSYVHLAKPIPVKKDDVVRTYNQTSGAVQACSMRYVCIYNASMQAVAELGTTTETNTFTVPEGGAYIAPSFTASAANPFFMLTINSVPTVFEEYFEPYYVATDEFNNIDIFDWSMVNRNDSSSCEVGKVINVVTGVLSDNASYFTTGYIPINPGETLYFYTAFSNTAKKAGRIAAFDNEKRVLESGAVSSETYSYTQAGSVAYIRASFPYVSGDTSRTPEKTVVMSADKPDYTTGYGGEKVIKSQYIRRKINVYATDTEAQVIQKLVNAYMFGECDVIFERATYTLGTALATVQTDYNLNENEIPVGNGCRYFFNGSTLTATIDLESHPAVGDIEFYVNLFGVQRVPSSFEMHDGILIATDTRYVMHDESSGLAGSYRHLYQNMEMYYYTQDRTESIRKCIGGGTGESGVVEIIGCKFITDATANCVAFHGNGTDVEGAAFDLNVRNCWFSNSLRVNQMSDHQTARIMYTGNSATENPTIGDNCALTSFLNEVRT